MPSFLKVLWSCFLCFDIPAYSFCADVSSCGYKEASGPQIWHPAETTKLRAEFFGSSSLNELHNIRWALNRQTAKEQVSVIMMAFHCQDFDAVLLADEWHQFFETFLYARNIEYFASESRTENKVVVNERYSGHCTFILIFHVCIISCHVHLCTAWSYFRNESRLSSHHCYEVTFVKT